MQINSKSKSVFIEKGASQLDVNAVQDADSPDGRHECQTISYKESIVTSGLFITFLIIQKIHTWIGTFFNIKLNK